MPKWSSWESSKLNPYRRWQQVSTNSTRQNSEHPVIDFRAAGLDKFGEPTSHVQAQGSAVVGDDGGDIVSKFEQALEELNAPLPTAFEPSEMGDNLPPWDDLPELDDPETVIMGVIDVGIPLGHRRLRDADGTSRVLAAWQQLSSERTPYMPFGREVLKGEIDDLIADCSGQSHKGWLDEERFNQLTDVVDMHSHFGQREAARFTSHGAHVMDLAAGCDPDEEPTFSKRVKIIAVNMPTIDVVGHSGEFLGGFALAGVERILTLADAIWKKSFGINDDQPPAPCPCPIVINMSFGRQAGAKNSVDLFPAYLNAIRLRRRAAIMHPIEQAAKDAAEAAPQGAELNAAQAVLQSAASAYISSVSAKSPLARVSQHLEDLNGTWPALKDTDDLAQSINETVAHAGKYIWPDTTLNLVMACGNDNLERCSAILEPEHDQTMTLDWRISPDDQSPNFVEIWTTPPKTEAEGPSDAATRIAVTLTPPNGGAQSPATSARESGFTALGKIASVYREEHVLPVQTTGATSGATSSSAGVKLVRHVLYVGPTHRPLSDQDTAEAGLWTISVTNKSGKQVQCVLSVQTDQGLLPSSATSRRSYFDDRHYTLYDDFDGMGNRRESYAYPKKRAGTDNFDLQPNAVTGQVSPVKRHGTMNATAAHEQVACVAGYRLFDGRPASYSGTGRGRSPTQDNPSGDDGAVVETERADESKAPNASLPSDYGALHWGVLAAGGANGSTVRMNGTSVAAPQAARRIAAQLIAQENSRDSEKETLRKLSVSAEQEADRKFEAKDYAGTGVTGHRPTYLTEALGRGRIAPPPRGSVDRFGRT